MLQEKEKRQIRPAQKAEGPEKSTVRNRSPAADSGTEPPKKVSFRSAVLIELFYLFVKIAAIAVAFILIFTYMFGIFRNTENAMNPAVKDGDLVCYYRLDHRYVAQDLTVVKFKGTYEVRRIIATAGDTVDIVDGELLINGAHQTEVNVYTDTERFDTGVEFPMTIPEGEVLLLGDNRPESTDSRVYGSVKVSDTMGKVVTVIRRRQF